MTNNKLTKEQYDVLINERTEAPYTGKYNDFYEEGIYECAQCGQKLFSSEVKYNSNTGWPSFADAIDGSIIFKEDNSFGMNRIEAECSKCGGHLGHVFDDGPKVLNGTKCSGNHYCINSAALDFSKKNK